MGTTTRTIRAQAAVWALLDAEAERRGVSANALAAELLQDALAPAAPEVVPVYREPAPKAQRAREAAREAEAKTGAAVMPGSSIASRAMAAAGIASWGDERRPYQKGQHKPGQAKAAKRR